MNKKIALVAAGLGVLGLVAGSLTTLTANAQLFPYTGSSSITSNTSVTTSSATNTANASATGTTTATATPTPSTSTNTSGTSSVSVPTLVTITGPNSGFIQFNHLVVANVSAITAPAEITAGNTTAGMTNMLGLGTCMQFGSETSAVGSPVACPVPLTPASNTSSTNNGSTTNGGTTTITTNQTVYAPYRIEVSAATKILLSDRTPGTLVNITSGDQINVFGSYNANGDGTIQASIIRDLSKPATPSGLFPVTTPLPTTTGSVLGASTTAIVNNPVLGTITTVNPDGSFVLLMSNGQNITIPSPNTKIQVGAAITLQQVLATIQQVLTEISILSSTTTSP